MPLRPPSLFRRTPKLIRQSDPENFHLSLLLRGEGAATWGRQQVAYGAQDFHVNCTSMAYEILTGTEPVTTVGIEIPRPLVALPARHADQVIGSRLSGREGVGTLLAQFLMQLAADTTPYRPSDAPRLGTVAAAHHISRGYLHRLFQAEGLTVAAYVRDQRLRNAYRDLTDADPVLRATRIRAIGARWGFPCRRVQQGVPYGVRGAPERAAARGDFQPGGGEWTRCQVTVDRQPTTPDGLRRILVITAAEGGRPDHRDRARTPAGEPWAGPAALP